MTWPTWITPPTRWTDRLAVWDLAFGRHVSVDLRYDGWIVHSPEIPQGMVYHQEEAAELAAYVEAQRIRPARVVLESIGAHNYMCKALADSTQRGEAPIITDDAHAWIAVADAVVVYEDFGILSGMQAAIDEAERLGVPVERRKIKEVM